MEGPGRAGKFWELKKRSWAKQQGTSATQEPLHDIEGLT